VFRGFAGVKSFRAKMTTTGGTTANQDMNLEVVMPDRFHMTSKQFEAYLIASTFYMKVGNQWQKIAMPKTLDLGFADAKKLEAQLGVTTETKLIGAEVLDGTPTTVYQYTTTINTPAATTVTSQVWATVSLCQCTGASCASAWCRGVYASTQVQLDYLCYCARGVRKFDNARQVCYILSRFGDQPMFFVNVFVPRPRSTPAQRSGVFGVGL
jgi:hypothetical protein